MFLEHALVRGEYRTRGTFDSKNRELLAEVARLRDKARQSDMMADDSAIVAVFDRRVPADVVNGKTFEAWRERAEREDPNVLVLSMEDILAGEPGLSPADYPDTIALHGVDLAVSYRFDPSAEDDGITVTVPLLLLPQIDPGELDWTIRGWHREKITALLHDLPRPLRRDLGPIPDLAGALAEDLAPFRGPMIPAIVAAIADRCGVDIPEDAFRLDAVATHLRTTCRVVGEGGKVIAQSKDVRGLFEQHGSSARSAWKDAAPPSRWERKGLMAWDFGDLPPFVTQRVSGTEIRRYPAVIDREASVEIALLESPRAADAATRGGVRRLLTIAARGHLSLVVPRIPPCFARPSGASPSRDENDAFRATVVARIVEDAFDVGPAASAQDGVVADAAPPPRTKHAFEDRLALGAPHIAPVARRYIDAITRASAELDGTLRALRSATKHPGAKVAIAEIRAQIEGLFPPDLLAWVPLPRLEHFPRYLRAAQARLGRAIADPRKDSEKLAQVAFVWSAFVAKEKTARDRASAAALRWSFEELRVAVFAPELKTPVPVTVARLAADVAALR
jgi:ATP-dependent helicase HrpA